jgi:hypothetical protein
MRTLHCWFYSSRNSLYFIDSLWNFPLEYNVKNRNDNTCIHLFSFFFFFDEVVNGLEIIFSATLSQTGVRARVWTRLQLNVLISSVRSLCSVKTQKENSAVIKRAWWSYWFHILLWSVELREGSEQPACTWAPVHRPHLALHDPEGLALTLGCIRHLEASVIIHE